jgi:outer membrane protein assembly factor BamB
VVELSGHLFTCTECEFKEDFIYVCRVLNAEGCMSDTPAKAQTSTWGRFWRKLMNESSSDDNDSEIIDLDAQRLRRFSSTSALRRGIRYILWAALLSSLLLLVLLVGPAQILLLLRGQSQQPFQGVVPWKIGHGVFLVADQTTIYVASRDNTLAALRKNNGRLLWLVPTDGPVSGKPVIVGGVVYASSATTIYAISAPTGRLIWHQAAAESLLGGQTIVGEGIVFIALANGSLAAWRASDGRQLWDDSLKDEALFPVAIADGMLFADTGRGSVAAVRAKSGMLLWKHAAVKFAPPLPLPGDSAEISVDVPSDTFASLQQTENGKLLWRHDFTLLTESESEAIAVAEGNDFVYVSQQHTREPGGSLTVLRASTGLLLWRCATGTGFIPPLVYSGAVYIGSQYGSLDARRIEDGSLLWHYVPGSYPLNVVTVAQNTVYLGTGMGTVEAVDTGTGNVRWLFAAGGPISDVTQDSQGVVFIGAVNGSISALQEGTGTPLWHSPPQV